MTSCIQSEWRHTTYGRDRDTGKQTPWGRGVGSGIRYMNNSNPVSWSEEFPTLAERKDESGMHCHDEWQSSQMSLTWRKVKGASLNPHWSFPSRKGLALSPPTPRVQIATVKQPRVVELCCHLPSDPALPLGYIAGFTSQAATTTAQLVWCASHTAPPPLLLLLPSSPKLTAPAQLENTSSIPSKATTVEKSLTPEPTLSLWVGTPHPLLFAL